MLRLLRLNRFRPEPCASDYRILKEGESSGESTRNPHKSSGNLRESWGVFERIEGYQVIHPSDPLPLGSISGLVSRILSETLGAKKARLQLARQYRGRI